MLATICTEPRNEWTVLIFYGGAIELYCFAYPGPRTGAQDPDFEAVGGRGVGKALGAMLTVVNVYSDFTLQAGHAPRKFESPRPHVRV